MTHVWRNTSNSLKTNAAVVSRNWFPQDTFSPVGGAWEIKKQKTTKNTSHEGFCSPSPKCTSCLTMCAWTAWSQTSESAVCDMQAMASDRALYICHLILLNIIQAPCFLKSIKYVKIKTSSFFSLSLSSFYLVYLLNKTRFEKASSFQSYWVWWQVLADLCYKYCNARTL